MALSKNQIDKAGKILMDTMTDDNIEAYLTADGILDDYRKIHLQPLTEMNLKLQEYFIDYNSDYYIAQRLKRKPQIIKKLNRFPVRLTQLQDIGGCRIIVNSNNDVDNLYMILHNKSKKSKYFTIDRVIDYREKGREDSGYRAMHLILSRNNVKIELQLRSRIQHYWAESIERTSIIYGHSLKEGEGDQIVLDYFKKTSDAFYTLENKNQPTTTLIQELDSLREKAEQIIINSDDYNILNSYVHDSVIKGMIAREALSKNKFNNWMIVFDWKNGNFISWELITKDPLLSIKRYSEHEKRYPFTDGFEVVMIGSSNVATIRKTHSHYFGIQPYEKILENLDESNYIFNKKKNLDADSMKLLNILAKKGYWAAKSVSFDTLKNHYCNDIIDFPTSLDTLIDKGYVVQSPYHRSTVSLNIKRKKDIEKDIK